MPLLPSRRLECRFVLGKVLKWPVPNKNPGISFSGGVIKYAYVTASNRNLASVLLNDLSTSCVTSTSENLEKLKSSLVHSLSHMSFPFVIYTSPSPSRVQYLG